MRYTQLTHNKVRIESKAKFSTATANERYNQPSLNSKVNLSRVYRLIKFNYDHVEIITQKAHMKIIKLTRFAANK